MEEFLQNFLTHDIPGSSQSEDAAGLKQHQTIAKLRRKIQIVRDAEYGASVFVSEPPQESVDGVAMAGIQMRRRFVEKNQGRFLSQSARQQRPLPFAGAQAADAAPGETADSDQFHRAISRAPIVCISRSEECAVRMTPEQDKITRAVIKRWNFDLWLNGAESCALPRSQRTKVATFYLHATSPQWNQSRQRPEQRAFSTSVGAGDAENLAGGKLKTYPVQNILVPVARADVVNLQGGRFHRAKIFSRTSVAAFSAAGPGMENMAAGTVITRPSFTACRCRRTGCARRAARTFSGSAFP